jgi:hypothetical protein
MTLTDISLQLGASYIVQIQAHMHYYVHRKHLILSG